MAASGSNWQWLTLSDAYQKREPRQWLVAGLLPIPSVTVLYGAPGSLKTMLVQDLACCVVRGKPWLESSTGEESLPFQTEKAAVLWVDMDNGRDRLARRFAALGREHGVPQDAQLYYVCFPHPPFEAAMDDSIQRVVSKAKEVGAKLIVFDNLGVISGEADENSSQMVRVMAGLRRIAEETRAAVVVIHHKSKGDRARKGDGLRGHSSIESAVDLALLIDRKDGRDTVTLESTKSRDALVTPFSAQWTYKNAGMELTKGRFCGLASPPAQRLSSKEKAKQCILEHMRNSDNQTQLVDLVKEKTGVGRTTALEAIKELVSEGRIVRTEVGSAAIYHRCEEQDNV